MKKIILYICFAFSSVFSMETYSSKKLRCDITNKSSGTVLVKFKHYDNNDNFVDEQYCVQVNQTIRCSQKVNDIIRKRYTDFDYFIKIKNFDSRKTLYEKKVNCLSLKTKKPIKIIISSAKRNKTNESNLKKLNSSFFGMRSANVNSVFKKQLKEKEVSEDTPLLQK